MTLAEQLTSDLSVFFNTDEFAETLTVRVPGTPGTSTIKATVDVVDGSVSQAGRTTDQIETIEVECAKTTAAGGLVPPVVVGTELQWGGNWYAFEGDIANATAQTQRLRFVRAEPYSAGGQIMVAPAR